MTETTTPIQVVRIYPYHACVPPRPRQDHTSQLSDIYEALYAFEELHDCLACDDWMEPTTSHMYETYTSTRKSTSQVCRACDRDGYFVEGKKLFRREVVLIRELS